MLIVLLGILIRLCVSLHSYSGQNKPPMFGDYEAQRHWMEVTYNLPVKDWYFNTTDNDLMYWGLDYPPLTAYHSWICGHFAAYMNTSFVELHSSRGFESESHKYFMRFTVLLADVITFIPAVVLYYLLNKRGGSIGLNKAKEYSMSTNEATKLCCLLTLLYPGLIIIDHGHFQYNCVSLGLFVFAVSAITLERHVISSILFCCALTYKQMELYHALPFFFYLLGNCFSTLMRQGFGKAVYKFLCLCSAVIVTLVLICSPYITDFRLLTQLISRLFPIARGVFEDKVANVWCLVNIAFKLKVFISNEHMIKICVLFTCLAIIPSSYDIFINNTLIKFKYSLINSSLSFYLFSYQVHEKSILLAAVPVLLVLPYDPLACVWFLSLSVFSMLPLIIKDQLLVPYIALSILFILVFKSSSFNKKAKDNENNITSKSPTLQFLKRHLHIFYYLSLFGCATLTICISVLEPPQRYPDILPLLISVYSCLHFLGFLVYFNVKQWLSSEKKNKYE